MNNTTSETPQEGQDPEVFEYMGWWIFWVLFCLLTLNLTFLLLHTDFLEDYENFVQETSGRRRRRRRATAANSGFYSSPTARTCSCEPIKPFARMAQLYNQGPGFRCNEERVAIVPFKFIPTSPVFQCITSRTMQCNIVIVSSLLLLAQIIEGYWILEMLARYMSQAVEPAATEAAPAKSFVLISLIPHIISFVAKFLAKLLAWLVVLGVGVSMVALQHDFIKEVLRIRIEEQPAECQCGAKIINSVNMCTGIDLELGKLKVIWESPGE